MDFLTGRGNDTENGTRRQGLLLILTVAILVLFITIPLHAGPKTDTVVLVNGDRITGEIRSLDRGRLTFHTDIMKTIYIDMGQCCSGGEPEYLPPEY